MSGPTEITFDIVVSGCATQCWHCYVCGRPAPAMALRDVERVLAFVDAFSRIAEDQGVLVHPYLDLEPMLHPDIVTILSLSQAVDAFSMPTCIPTTGIPIARRDDWRRVLAAYRQAGVRQLEFTLHGPEAIHDEAVSREGAFQSHNQAVRRAKESGFEARLNLMVSKPMLRHVQETMDAVDRNAYDHRRAAIPTYAPNARLRGFERLRPELPDVMPHRALLRACCDDQDGDGNRWKTVAGSTEGRAYQNLLASEGACRSYQSLIESLPTWYFVTVGPDRDVRYGNGLHRTDGLGRVGESPPAEVLQRVLERYPNYALGGYFPIDSLPAPIEVARAVADPRGGRIYHTTEEIHVMWLDQYLFGTRPDPDCLDSAPVSPLEGTTMAGPINPASGDSP